MNILIVESRFFPAVADTLADGATLALERGGARFERFSVPGVLELPAAIAIAAQGKRGFDGYVALGCVLTGTAVAPTLFAETLRGLVALGGTGLALGHGVVLAEDEDAAIRVAQDQDAGGDAARAALALAVLRQRLAPVHEGKT